LSDARPASDVSDWAKSATKPAYTAVEVGALPSTTTIPAAQVQSDWNATAGLGVILNKPDLTPSTIRAAVYTDILNNYPAGLTQWIDGQDPLGTGTAPADGTTLSTVKDKIGLANWVTTGNPTYDSTKKAISFSITQGVVNLGSVSANSGWMIVYVWAYKSVGVKKRVIQGNNGTVMVLGNDANGTGGIYLNEAPNWYRMGYPLDGSKHIFGACKLSTGELLILSDQLYRPYDFVGPENGSGYWYSGVSASAFNFCINTSSSSSGGINSSDCYVYESIRIVNTDVVFSDFRALFRMMAWRNGLNKKIVNTERTTYPPQYINGSVVY
jgi:hypothetical protein